MRGQAPRALIVYKKCTNVHSGTYIIFITPGYSKYDYKNNFFFLFLQARRKCFRETLYVNIHVIFKAHNLYSPARNLPIFFIRPVVRVPCDSVILTGTRMNYELSPAFNSRKPFVFVRTFVLDANFERKLAARYIHASV